MSNTHESALPTIFTVVGGALRRLYRCLASLFGIEAAQGESTCFFDTIALWIHGYKKKEPPLPVNMRTASQDMRMPNDHMLGHRVWPGIRLGRIFDLGPHCAQHCLGHNRSMLRAGTARHLRYLDTLILLHILTWRTHAAADIRTWILRYPQAW